MLELTVDGMATSVPKGATLLDPNALIELDELPPGASEGGTK